MQTNYQIIQNIKFFDNPSSCISHFKGFSWGRRTISFIDSFGAFLSYGLQKISLLFRRAENRMSTMIDGKQLSKKRLIVCVHGLNSRPLQFKSLVDELKQKNLSTTDIFIPHVLEKGNAPIEKIVIPIFEKIAQWASNKDERELVLVGISNGGRIARSLETKIATSEQCRNIKNLRVVSIVGANKGSSLAGLANRIGLSRLMSKNISKEMPTNSESIKKLNQDWEGGVKCSPHIKRDYTFIASPHDWQIPNYESTLPESSNQNARYAIVPNHGHNSIVDAVAKTVAEIINKSKCSDE